VELSLNSFKDLTYLSCLCKWRIFF